MHVLRYGVLFDVTNFETIAVGAHIGKKIG